jgi:hypothetical protein
MAKNLPADSIHLRQTVQVPVGAQVHTIEVSITLPPDATPDAIAGAVQTAANGISQMTTILKEQIASLYAAPAIDTTMPINAAPTPSEPASTPATEAMPEPTSDEQSLSTRPAKYTPTTRVAFLKAAKEYGFDSEGVVNALGTPIGEITDFASALERLKMMTQTSTPQHESDAAPAPARGFAEEIGAYESAVPTPEEDLPDGYASSPDLDELDEPDFAPVDMADEDEIPPEPAKDPSLILRASAQARLQRMRQLRPNGAPATPELRTALMNLVIGRLGKERAQELIMTIWNPPAGEKLNAARTRELVEWSKEDDQFEETADLVMMLARVPQPAMPEE